MDLFESFIKRLIFTPESVGLHGEKMIVRKLGWVQFCGKRGKILQNIYVPRENGETSEIDVLYITQKGIFVIESKNYSGYIFGSENNHNWTSTLYAGKDQLGRKKVEHHQFYNPVKQNNTHIKTLMHYLNVDIPMLSLIVFSERCELKSITLFSPDVFVCNRGALPRLVRKIWNVYPDVLNEMQISTIFNALQPLTNQDEATKTKHISDIQSKLNYEETCTWCGVTLVLRTAKRGINAGHQFWGCINYPKCKYTQNL